MAISLAWAWTKATENKGSLDSENTFDLIVTDLDFASSTRRRFLDDNTENYEKADVKFILNFAKATKFNKAVAFYNSLKGDAEDYAQFIENWEDLCLSTALLFDDEGFVDIIIESLEIEQVDEDGVVVVSKACLNGFGSFWTVVVVFWLVAMHT